MPHLPVPDSLLPFWRTNPHPLDNHRSTESLPQQSDIVIIGAGYSGASIAHHLLNQSKTDSSPSITILEARQACSGATARNGRIYYHIVRFRLLMIVFFLTQSRGTRQTRPLQLYSHSCRRVWSRCRSRGCRVRGETRPGNSRISRPGENQL